MGTFVPVLQGKIDVALSNFAREYRNAAFVADRVLPRVAVTKQSDKYWLFGREGQIDPGDELRAPGAAAIELVQTISTNSYFADDHAASRIIPDEERADFEAGDVEEWATRMVTDRLLLKQEIRTKDLVTDATQFAAANKKTLSGTSKWSDLNNSDPIADVLAAIKQVGLIGTPANLMVIGPDTFEVLVKHPKITERFINVQAGAITLADLVQVFGLPVVLAQAVQRSAAGAQSYVWPDSVLVAFVNPGASLMDPSFGKTFVWTTAPGTSQGFAVEVNRVFPASRKADSLDVHFYYDEKLTSAESGYLIIDTV